MAADALAWFRYPGYSPVSQVFSGLLANGAPTCPFMLSIVGPPYNLLVVALGAGVWLSPGRHARLACLTSGMLVLYALCSFLGGTVFNMDMRGAEVTARGSLHPLQTGVMSLFIMLAVGFGAALQGRRFRSYSIATLLTLVVFGVLTSLDAPQLAADEPTPWMGLEERVTSTPGCSGWRCWRCPSGRRGDRPRCRPRK